MKKKKEASQRNSPRTITGSFTNASTDIFPTCGFLSCTTATVARCRVVRQLFPCRCSLFRGSRISSALCGGREFWVCQKVVTWLTWGWFTFVFSVVVTRRHAYGSTVAAKVREEREEEARREKTKKEEVRERKKENEQRMMKWKLTQGGLLCNNLHRKERLRLLWYYRTLLFQCRKRKETLLMCLLWYTHHKWEQGRWCQSEV